MISLTPAALEKIRAMQKKEEKKDCGLRFGVVTGGCAGFSYEMNFQKRSFENDIVIEIEDIRIFINEESAPFIKGTQIDYADTLKESGFKYRNPNAQGSCG